MVFSITNCYVVILFSMVIIYSFHFADGFRPSNAPKSVPIGINTTDITAKDINALIFKGVGLYLHGKYEEAIIWFDKALAIDPNNIDALYNKAQVLSYMMGKYEESLPWV
jgi:tetratricopeptide (TPR) repeat protein